MTNKITFYFTKMWVVMIVTFCYRSLKLNALLTYQQFSVLCSSFPALVLVILRLYQVANLCTSYAFNIICSILIDFLHNILWLLDFRIITILTQKLLIKSIKTTKDQAIFSYMDIWSSVHIGIEEYTRKRMNLTCLFIFHIIFSRRCWNFFNIWCGKLWEKKSLTEGVHQKE